MSPYIFKRNREGIHIINVGKAWEKLMLAARVIAAITNPQDVLVSALNHWPLDLNLPRFVHPLGGHGVPIDCLKQRIRTKSSP